MIVPAITRRYAENAWITKFIALFYIFIAEVKPRGLSRQLSYQFTRWIYKLPGETWNENGQVSAISQLFFFSTVS